MNLFVADPHWGWWIILYFFCGGIAAGAYFAATLIDLAGREEDRALARLGYRIAFPLVAVCGVFLIVDLNRPERFWHMLVRSEVVKQAFAEGSWRRLAQAPLLKYWSPMSVGSWALMLFGACSGLSFLGTLWPGGRLDRLLRRGVPGRALQVVGCGVGFFIASYTGALLTATNLPLWSDTTWVAPLFLTSAASTGLAALILLGRFRGGVPDGSLHRLEQADRWALLLELAVFATFLASLGGLLLPVLGTLHGKLLVGGALVLGILLPLALHLRPGRATAAATLALLGGFVMRYAILSTPPELLAHAPRTEAIVGERGERPALVPGFTPEAGRDPGERGADPGNRPVEVRSKVYGEP